MKKVISILTMLLLLCFPAYSQDESLTDSLTEQKSKMIEIYFDLNSYAIDSMYMRNRESIRLLFDSLNTQSKDSSSEIAEVVICSYTSPDGDLTSNAALSQSRTEAIYQYLIEKCSISESLITLINYGVAWELMREYVVDSEVVHKEEVVEILDSEPAEIWGRVELGDRWLSLVDSRNKHLMDLRYGRPYLQMFSSIFPYLRKSSIEVRYVRNKVEAAAEIVDDSIVAVEPVANTEVEDVIISEPSNEIAEVAEVAETAEVVEAKEERTEKMKAESLPRDPIFVVKTNLIGLGMGVANIGVEVPIKDHFSIDGSAYYSPYTIDNEWRIRLAMLQPEVRYWLSTPLNKHFFGLHAQVGLFNVSTNQWSRYQNSTDQPLWGFGLSYGYALYLSRAFSLEFNIGAGYSSLSYDTFYNVENGAQYDHTERGYWGVTRAGISVNYIINHK